MFACSLSCLLLGQSQYTIFSQSTSVAQFSPNRRQLLNFLPIDVSCSMFFLILIFFRFFSAQTRFCFFEKNTFFLSHCGHVEGFTAMRGCPTFHTSCIRKFLHIDHHLSIFRFFFSFFLVFCFFVFSCFFLSGCGAFERLRCT